MKQYKRMKALFGSLKPPSLQTDPKSSSDRGRKAWVRNIRTTEKRMLIYHKINLGQQNMLC